MTSSVLELFDSTAPWQLSREVSLREEAFGALAYHHGNRRLIFLKSSELVRLVCSLADYGSADAAIEAIVPQGQHARYVKALSSLRRSELLSGR
ncbi:MAG: mycofactocin biosynthesis chaperone MftB [Acidimicrobiales bacterium]